MNKLKIGLIQMKVSQNKKENLDKAYNLIKDLTCKRVDIVVLPEMFSTPYVTSNFPLYAEKEGDYSYNFLSNIAKENNIYLQDLFLSLIITRFIILLLFSIDMVKKLPNIEKYIYLILI